MPNNPENHDEFPDKREEIISKMRVVAQNIRARNIEGFILGVKYKAVNEDGQGNLMMIGDPVVEIAMAGKMMGLIVDDLFKMHKDDPKQVIGLFLKAMMEGESIKQKDDDKEDSEEKKKIEESLKNIKIDDDLKKKIDGDVPGLDDLLGGK